jgi:DNA adenine methylase
MILRRLGNKKKIAHEIIKHFPDHKIYIEPFFGAGGMFFNKPKVKYNIVNDLDSDVFNLFQVVMNQKEELEKAFYIMPIHSDLLDYWKKNLETDPIKKALRFLFLSNLTLYGDGATVKYATDNDPKEMLLKNLSKTFEILNKVQFMNKDFRKFLKSIYFEDRANHGKNETLIYADPPYISTTDNYSNNFTESDSIDLFKCLQETGCKYAMSEFDNPFIIDQAKQRGLNVITIGERQNLKNRRTEILITNYKNVQGELF